MWYNSSVRKITYVSIVKDDGDREVTALSRNEIQKLNLAIADIYALREPGEFFAKIVVIIRDLLSSDTASYNECDSDIRFKKVVTSSPHHDRIFRKYETPFMEYISTHPGFDIASPWQCIILSDVIKPSAFKRTELYNEYYRHLDVHSQMFTELPAPGGMRSFLMLTRAILNFTEGDRFMLGIVRPHIVRAYRNAMELQLYREKVALFERGEEFPALRALGLTGSEAVVLGWAAKGKTNADIALILGISRRTVEKHLERIYEKLGVETKIAAVSAIVNAPSPLSSVVNKEKAV